MFTRWQQTSAGKMILSLLIIATFGARYLQQVGANEVVNASGIQIRNSDYEYEYVSKWPSLARKLGSVSAVAFDTRGNVVIFHRGSHVWNLQSFDEHNRYNLAKDGPIDESTILSFNSESGALIDEWGANYFYMPHGLTIDKNNSYWLTDVAQHQVFKFDLSVSRSEPVLKLGHLFEPGNDATHFCKPTSVAVLENGDFFVADGYCNGRVMKFTASGQLILSWGKNSFVLTRTFNLPPGPVPESFFAIPHALTYAADKNLLCVADREQGRIQCFNAINATFHSMYSNEQIGSRIFSVKYVPQDGGVFYVINGPQFTTTEPINGFILSMSTKEIVGRFYPSSTQMAFNNPHELAVSANGNQIYVAELAPANVHKFKRKVWISTAKGSQLQTFPPEEPAEAQYTGTLTMISMLVSLMGISCLIFCVARTMCFKPGGIRRQRFSTPSENISLRNLDHAGEEQRMV